MTNQDKVLYVPKKGVFEATLACNLRCKHCGSSAGIPRADELSTKECASLFAQLKDLGVEDFAISGGEPTTRPDWLELIESAAATGMRVSMISNGVKLDKETIARAKEKGLKGLGISVDGVGQTHDHVRGRIGHFDHLLSVMKHCQEVGLPFAPVTHVTKRNIEELDHMLDLFQKNGAYGWQVQLGMDMGNMCDERELLLKPRDLIALEARLGGMIQKSSLPIHASDSIGYFGPNEKLLRQSDKEANFGGCSAGIRVIGIESNGNVKGCLSMFAGYNEQSDQFVEGNIRQESLESIWFKPGSFAYNREWSSDQMTGFCADCDKLSVCRGGCMAKRVTAQNVQDNPMCVYRAIQEEGNCGQKVAGHAAAAVLVTLLGAASPSCYTGPIYSPPMPPNEEETDSGTDSGTDTNTDSDTDTNMDSDTDTNTDSDTNGLQ